MPVDYTVASLQPLDFNGTAPYPWETFAGMLPEDCVAPDGNFRHGDTWLDLETQLRNAMATARGGEKNVRPAVGCSLYWQNRVSAAFNEKDPLKRETLLDCVWWDAAGELTPVAAPLSRGALETYAIRLKIALKRSAVSKDAGNTVFDRLTAGTETIDNQSNFRNQT